MPVRFHVSSFRAAAALWAVLLAFAAVADNAAICPDEMGTECPAPRNHDAAPPTAPAHDCAGRPCGTPVNIAPPDLALVEFGTVSTLLAETVQAPTSAEPAAPPTPPPVDRR